MATNCRVTLCYSTTAWVAVIYLKVNRNVPKKYSPVLFAVSVVCYGIVMGVGWYLWWADQDNTLVLAAAIVSSVSGLSIILYFCSAITIKVKCCEEHSLIKCGIFTTEGICWTASNCWYSTVHLFCCCFEECVE